MFFSSSVIPEVGSGLGSGVGSIPSKLFVQLGNTNPIAANKNGDYILIVHNLISKCHYVTTSI
jgi:hypothetical protein